MKDVRTGQLLRLFVAPVLDLIDISFIIPWVTPLTSGAAPLSFCLHPLSRSPPPTHLSLIREREGKGGCVTESEGMHGRSANTFVGAWVMGATTAMVSHGNDLCRRLASKWAKNQLNSH